VKSNSVLAAILVLGFFSALWAKDVPDTKVVAYYFYTNFRCPSCHKIQQYTKEALEKYFSDDFKSGKLVYKPLNIESEANQHFVKEYQLYSKSVVISMVNGGKEIKHKNLTKIWEYLRDKEQFCDYIKTETAQYLDEVK
jgi:thiol-disulfide isomerase/thioredoxin